MNRYHRGSSTIAAFKIWIDSRAQLKVENPVTLRTIWKLDLLPFSERHVAVRQQFFTRKV
jgi:hypothetical protein